MSYIYKIVHNYYSEENPKEEIITTYVAASDLEYALKCFLEKYPPWDKYSKIREIVYVDNGDVIME